MLISAAITNPNGETLDILTANMVYRQLVAKGLEPGEAANVAAYLNGIAICDQPWTVRELDYIIFLHELSKSGRFGANDGSTRPYATRLVCS